MCYIVSFASTWIKQYMALNQFANTTILVYPPFRLIRLSIHSMHNSCTSWWLSCTRNLQYHHSLLCIVWTTCMSLRKKSQRARQYFLMNCVLTTMSPPKQCRPVGLQLASICLTCCCYYGEDACSWWQMVFILCYCYWLRETNQLIECELFFFSSKYKSSTKNKTVIDGRLMVTVSAASIGDWRLVDRRREQGQVSRCDSRRYVLVPSYQRWCNLRRKDLLVWASNLR